jgi:hypothetical protein
MLDMRRTLRSAARATASGLSAALPARRLDVLVRPGWSRSRAMCWDTMKHPFDGDVLVDIRPVHSLT